MIINIEWCDVVLPLSKPCTSCKLLLLLFDISPTANLLEKLFKLDDVQGAEEIYGECRNRKDPSSILEYRVC